jgi:arginyl-tRNA synthetase
MASDMKELTQAIQNSVVSLYGNSPDNIDVTRPDPQFGDYATNVAMQLAKQLGKNPRDIAVAIANDVSAQGYDWLRSITVAGPGFLNIFITDAFVLNKLSNDIPQELAGSNYVVEYSCPNAFKELHAGHLYQTIVGDVVSRILQTVGATVHRTNFGGDVGLHVGKAMYGIISLLGGEYPGKLDDVPATERAQFLSKAYVQGAKAYEDGGEPKKQIEGYNQEVYSLHENNDTQSTFAQIYWTCRQWSYDYFDNFYNQIEVDSFKYYPESTCTPPGLALVQQALEQEIFIKSDGAVIYPEEKSGLHTRVFVTGSGLPTYETKDLGVIKLEYDDFAFDHRVLLTGRDQSEYMKVVFAAAGELIPPVKGAMTHITNGIIKFGDGKKMSSRLGNVTTALDVIDTVRDIVMQNNSARAQAVMLGAVKYEFLKYKLGGDIAFNPDESVSIQGNSGPYLQYAHARARSILAKANKDISSTMHEGDLDTYERALAVKIGEYSEVITKAAADLMPHYVCSYLYELAQVFNRFYENSKVIGDARESVRLQLVSHYADTLKNGLSILGIQAPDHM